MTAADYGLKKPDPREREKSVEEWLKERNITWEFRYIPKDYVNVPVREWKLHFEVSLTRGNNHHTFPYSCGLACVGMPPRLLAAATKRPDIKFLKSAKPLGEFDLKQITALSAANPMDHLHLLYGWLNTPALRFENMYDGDNETIRRRRKAQFGTGPEIGSVLLCLISDARTVLHCFDFESWADELGYDKDSRSHERIYTACREQTSKLQQIISPSQWDDVAGLMGE